MSHITLEEYIASLPQSLSETQKVEKANEWKQTHQPKQDKVEVEEVEIKEEVKEPAVAEKDTTVTAETTEVSEPSDSGDGELVSQEIKPGEFAAGMSTKQLDATRNYQKQYESVAKTGEVYSPEDDSYQYKFEVTPENKLAYYYKGPNDSDFILQKDEYASVKIGQKFNHYNEKQLEIIKNLDKQKALEKDLNIGNTLTNAKLDPPVTEVEKAGKFLNIKEIEAQRKNQKARITFGIEELDLDQKISDEIYDENLDVDNYYSQFKDKNYTGKHSDWTSSAFDDESVVEYRFEEDFNPSEANTFLNSEDFLGFLNEEGLMNDYINNYYDDSFGSLGTYDISAEEYDDLELARQRKLDNYFNLYIQDANNKHNKQVLLSYIVNNKNKFKEAKTLSEAVNMAEKIFEEKYGQSYFPKIDYREYKAFREKQFPELIQAEKELQAARKRKSQELIEEGSSEGLLQDSFSKFYRGVMDRAQEQAYELRDLLGFDTGVGRNLDAEENIKKSFDQVRYGYVEGKTAEINGIDYIKDDEGNIYNITNKVVFIPSSDEELKKISETLDASEKRTSSFSSAGSTEQFFATAGTMLFDISSIYSLGKVTKATKLGKLAQAVRIPKASFDAATYYTMAGYVSTKKNTFEELIASGVNEVEAASIAEETGRIGGLWMGATSFIAPTTTYMKQFNKFLGNKNTLQSALKGYKKSGPQGFVNNFKTTLKNIKPTKEGVIKTIGAGGQEFGQEELQQLGEFGIVNAYANRIIGKDILKENFTRQDFINTGIVSFASGGAFSNLNIPGFKPSAAQQLNNLYVLGKDLKTTQQLMNEAVASGDATQEEVGKVMAGIKSVKNQMSRIPASVSSETKLESARLQQDIADLQAKKKRIDEVYHASINSQIDTKKKELAEIVKPELEKAAARKGAKIAAEQLGSTFENFTSQESIDKRSEELKNEGFDVQESTGYGMALTNEDTGKKIILINDQAAAEDNIYTTDQHEVLHPFWEAALKENPEAAITLGKALIAEIVNNKDITGGFEFMSRFQQYLTDPNYSAKNTWEEVIPLVSEALSKGDIQYNPEKESWWKNLGTKITNFLKGNKKPLNLEFNTGKDVFDFIRGYNETIEAGKGLTAQQLKVTKEGAKGKLIEGELETEGLASEIIEAFEGEMKDETAQDIAKESKKIEDSQEVQKIYDEQGVGAAFDIIQKFKPITNRIVESRSQAPNFDRQLLTDEIETGPRGILDLITEYKPESGVPLAAYINKFLPARAIEASKRVLGEEFTADVTEAKGVVAEEAAEVTVKEKPIAKKPSETVEFSQTQIEKIGAKDKAEVETRITEATNEAFKGQDIKTFGQTRNVPKAVADIYANMFGLNPQTITDKTRNYQKTDAEGLTIAKQFLLKNAANDFSRLPETKDGFGKGTFLPRNVMNALYTDGKLTGTLKDYMDLIRQKPTKPIYRDAVGQTIRGLLNLHIRNRMFETLVPTTAERAVGGAKFSKRIDTEEQIIKNKKLDDLFKEVAQAKSIIDVGKIIGIKGKITVNDSNRAQKQEQMLDFIKTGNIPSSVFEMAKFQNFAKRKVDGVYVNLPARGGLYYGKSDPAYQTALDAAKENDSKYPDLAIPKRVNVNKAFTEKGINQSKENAKFFNSFVNILNDAVNKNGLPIEIAALYITSAYQATTGIIKIAAPFKYKSTKFEYAGKDASKAGDNKGKKFREEHTIPASVIGANLILAIQKNAVKPVMKAIEDNYFQVQLSKKDDTKLDKANLDSTLFEGQTIFNNPISRLAGANINLQTIVNPLNGKTIAEENGVGINSKIYNNLNTDSKIQASAIQNEQIIQGLSNPELNVKEFIDLLVPLAESKSKESKRLNNDLSPNSLKYDTFTPIEKVITDLGTADKALNNGRKLDPTIKKIRVFDFDDTLARSKSKVIVNMPDGSTKKINATQFAEQASTLQSEGAEFDFTEFEQVIDGKKGPLFNVAKKIAETRGTEDLFILTARPQAAAGPIKAFMKALGINIPLKNITGLGDGTAAAKGRWIASKAAEGYNDFYFADDATKNVAAVKEVLDQIDVKSRVQIAKASKRKTFDTVVNDMIESSSGIESYKKFSAAKARTIGRDKGRFDFITLASSAEDFKGLLYRLIGDGKQGEAQFEFLKNNLIDPYNRAEDTIVQAKISAANDFMALKEQFKGLPKTLETETGVGKFTYQHALRVYMWTKQDMSIPGLSKADARKLNKFITDDAQLQAFADQLISIQKGKPYPEPGKDWLGGNLTTDIIGGINKVNRAEYQQEWRENVEIIFSPENLNKMEAAYGTRWRKALENTLKRMKAGTNRLGYNDATSNILDWVNNSVGAVMFLNTRSALLQTISAVNFINWGDNNIIKAGASVC